MSTALKRPARVRGDATGYWRNPETGSLDRICVIGVPPETTCSISNPSDQIVRRSPSPMPCWLMNFRELQIRTVRTGRISELSGHRVRVVGTFKLGINAQSNGNLIMSDRNLLKIFPQYAGLCSVKTR